jgi:hypothetical protein
MKHPELFNGFGNSSAVYDAIAQLKGKGHQFLVVRTSSFNQEYIGASFEFSVLAVDNIQGLFAEGRLIGNVYDGVTGNGIDHRYLAREYLKKLSVAERNDLISIMLVEYLVKK